MCVRVFVIVCVRVCVMLRVFTRRGCAHAGLKRWTSAVRDADKAVALRGLWVAPRLLRGRALEASGRWTAAAECYTSVGVALLFYTTHSFIDTTHSFILSPRLLDLRRLLTLTEVFFHR